MSKRPAKRSRNGARRILGITHRISTWEAVAGKSENAALHGNMYAVAFLEGDKAEMNHQVAWAIGKPGAEDNLLSISSDTEAYYGRMGKAREISRRAVDSAKRNDQKETAALWQMNSALRDAEVESVAEARRLSF
jgi:hypothetical protein